MADLLPVAFRGDTLYLVEIEGEPFTPARPICDAIGVSWQGQHEKLTLNPKRWGVRYTLTPTAGGDQQSICIPVRKLSGWLASINAAKVKPEIREKMEAYQDECDDALWRYWSEGYAGRGEASITPDYISPLSIGERVQSLATGRPGKIAKVYPDGSVSVCWDDGEPQAEGQGHERLPRRLLEYIPPTHRTTYASRPRSQDLPKLCSFGWQGDNLGAARMQLESASGLLAGIEFAPDRQTRLDPPAAMALSEWMDEMSAPGEGWSPAEDEPAELSDSFAELQSILDAHAKAYAKEHSLSYGEAIGTVCGQAMAELTATDDRIEELSSIESSGIEGNGDLIDRPAQSGVTLRQRVDQLNSLQNDTWDMLNRISNHLKTLWVVSDDDSTTAESIDMGVLVDIGLSIVEPYSDLLCEMEDVIMDIERRLFRQPEAGSLLQESVWLDLVAELATERKVLSGKENIQIASLATNLHLFASSSPEVAAALGHLQSFMKRYGVNLYEHSPSNTMCFNWIPGREPVKRRPAVMSD